MAKVTVNIHPVRDQYSLVVWLIGGISGGVTRKRLHAQICLQSGDVRVCYDLRNDGVNTLDIGEPTDSYSFEVEPLHIRDMLDRIEEYRSGGYRVSLKSLWRALWLPNEIHWNLCTSFVDYVFYGKIYHTANRIETFKGRYQYEASIRRA